MKRYKDIVDSAKGRNEKFENEPEIVNNIMRTIRSRRRMGGFDIIFGWADIVWLRRSLTFASLLIVVIFVFQQYVIIDKISLLESRMVDISTQSLLDYQKESAIANTVKFTDEQEILLQDSIIVASKDLTGLIKSYRDLQKKYIELQDEAGSGTDGFRKFISNKNKQKL